MKLIKLTATFGGLAGQTLTLTEGLNILEYPNEGGKSTWCAFLRAMFYGLKNRGKTVSERRRYTPWSGAAASGTVELEWRGKAITLRRFPKGSDPFGGFEAVYTGTREPVPGLTADNVGEVLLGVPREVYERTAFIPQGGLAVDGAAALEARIAALASAGEEDVSFSQTERKLRDWKNARQSNRSVGAIPKARGELERVRDQRDRVAAARARAEEARDTLERLEGERREVREDLDRHAALRAAAYRARYEKARQEHREALDRHRELEARAARFGALPPEEDLRRVQGDIAYLAKLEDRRKGARNALAEALGAAKAAQAAADDPRWRGKTGDQAVEEARTLAAALDAPRKTGPWPWAALAIGLVLGAAGVAAGIMLTNYRALLLALGALFALGGIGICLGLCLAPRGAVKRQREGTYVRYSVSDSGELVAEAEGYARRFQAWQEAEGAVDRAQRELEDLEGEAVALRQQVDAFCAPFAAGADSLPALSAAVSRALTLGDSLARSAGEAEAARRVFEAVAEQGEPEEGPPAAGLPVHSWEEDRARLDRLERSIALGKDTLAQAQGEAQGAGDYAALTAAGEALSEELERLEEEYAALDLALEALTAANAQLQSRFSPAVDRVAGEYLARLTGGRYGTLAFDREFQVSTLAEGLPREHYLLSQGTADQAYLALRLAICRLTLPAEEGAPIVLDDALVNFDDGRLRAALRVLEELGEERQVLLFTCQHRENALR